MGATQLYKHIQLNNDVWVICDARTNFYKPTKAITFAIDTETQTYFNNKVIDTKKLFKKLKGLNTEEKRKALSNKTWCWQVYDEYNGFVMTNDFNTFLDYIGRAGMKYGWCYNSTFDFAQIDYEILSTGKWTKHEHKKTGASKAQPNTYESIHNDMGARYAYKLWFNCKDQSRHVHVHSVELRDFMKLCVGGLKRLLEDLDVRDNNGVPIRKLTMEYQAVNTNNLTDEEVAYCKNDVKGLYFAIKQFNVMIEQQSNGECSIFGSNTNLMTAGGFAKRMLLKSLYPKTQNPKNRIKNYQRQHPINETTDKWVRTNHLYRGGISYVNPLYKGKTILKTMYRYDVNSEYPYSMASIRDLIGAPQRLSYERYIEMSEEEKAGYEVILGLTYMYGEVKPNMLGMWYDPFRHDFVDIISEEGLHLIYEREFNEYLNWYDNVEYDVDFVILLKKGDYAYKDFVINNYELKASAKKEGNKTKQMVAKLLLNSSYGKLAERIERVSGHYELNEENGAIHFVKDSTEIDTSSVMSVWVGALITAYARTFILSKIREVCGADVKHNFIYIDTDSIHCFCDYDKADAYSLGGLKLEAKCMACKYILPKTYIDIETINKNGTIPYESLEVHSKGVSTNAVIADFKKKQKYKKHNLPTLELIDSKIAYGSKYICLQAMNVKGGKVLIPVLKDLARIELAPNEVLTNYDGLYIQEI